MAKAATVKAIDDIIGAEENTASPKKGAKKAAPKANKAEKPKEALKPKPILYKGLEVAEGVDPKAIAKAEKEGKQHADAILGKDADILTSYLGLGDFLTTTSGMFKSVKLYGQFLKEHVPSTQDIDSATRSNCKWLHEALNTEGHEDGNLLSVLGVNRIEDYRLSNPTNIRKNYRKLLEEQAIAAKAEEAGLTVEQVAEQEAEQEAKAKADEAAKEAELIEGIMDAVKQSGTKAKAAEMVGEVLDAFLTEGRKAGLEMMNSYAAPRRDGKDS